MKQFKVLGESNKNIAKEWEEKVSHWKKKGKKKPKPWFLVELQFFWRNTFNNNSSTIEKENLYMRFIFFKKATKLCQVQCC